MPTDPNTSFAAWREREALASDDAVAAKIGCHRNTVLKWRVGKNKVPGSILRACAAISYSLPPYERILTGDGMCAWMDERGLSERTAAAALGISRATVRKYQSMDGKAPPYVALAAAAVNAGIPPINHEPGDDFVRYPKIDTGTDVDVKSKGGVARARSLSPERRKEIAGNASRARWAKQRGEEVAPN